MMLPVSAPFHCSLMQPAADAMAEALSAVVVKPPRSAGRQRAGAADQRSGRDRPLLVEQVTGTVRWRESVLFMAQAGVTSFYEIGAGKVLAGLIKRIAETAQACLRSARPRTLPVQGCARG
jgi:[acyl-carrier-protein] S-malonyltransferase